MAARSNNSRAIRSRVPSLPKYVASLSSEERRKYKDKLLGLGNIDPYNVSGAFFSESMEMWPEVEFADIVTYLLLSTSRYTKEQIKAYKSLEAYQYFVAGWVRCVYVGKATDDVKILIAKVNHSQRLDEPPLTPWVAAQNNGTVLAGHCNCMAGFGEVCSHVGALLFAAEAGVRLIKSKTCTSVQCKWIMPTPLSKVPYQELCNIDFSSSKSKKKKLEAQISGHGPSSQLCASDHPSKPSTYVPSAAQISHFYEELDASNTHPAILSLIPPYNKSYCPKRDTLNIPRPLTDLYCKDLITLEYKDLLAKCKETFENMSVSPEQALAIEQATRSQSKSSVWFQMRAGRITASNFHKACHTDPALPSVSLIKNVCYGSQFSSKATVWGCTHEKKALGNYTKVMSDLHSDFTLEDSGLVVSPDYPYLGASPDGISSCTCHGTGCVEVKCPFCVRDYNLQDAVDSDIKVCLTKVSENCLQLNRTHPYWYQVQLQLLVSKLEFADFVVWTEADLYIERIKPDPSFLSSNLEKANELYVTAILPELLGKWYTRPVTDEHAVRADELYCYCRVKLDESLDLVCDNRSCLFRKFHLQCCGLSRKPTRKVWHCPDCRRVKKVHVGEQAASSPTRQN